MLKIIQLLLLYILIKKGGRGLQINKIASVYGRNNASNALKSFELNYLDKSKNPELSRLVHLLIMESNRKSQDVNASILTPNNIVNDPDVRFSRTVNDTDTKQSKSIINKITAHLKIKG